MRPGKRNLITDVPGLLVVTPTTRPLRSATVLTAAGPSPPPYVMGGSPARARPTFSPPTAWSGVDAFFHSGGSAFGLDAEPG